MERTLKELADQLEIMNQRIKKAREHRNISTLEIDIILDALKRSYIVAEQFKDKIISDEREKNPVTVYDFTSEERTLDSSHKNDKEQEIETESVKKNLVPVLEETQIVQELIEPSKVTIDDIPSMSFAEVKVQNDIQPATFTGNVESKDMHVPDTTSKINSVPQEAQMPNTNRVESFNKHSETSPSHNNEFAGHHTRSSVDLFGGPSISDKLKDESPSLNDKITHGRNDQTLADKMQLKPILDLKAAIGINDKFQFVNDLFEGHIDLYNEAISELNNCNSAIQADNIVNSLRLTYNWKDETESLDKLKIFVKRRYL
jgi:hypothetical protein